MPHSFVDEGSNSQRLARSLICYLYVGVALADLSKNRRSDQFTALVVGWEDLDFRKFANRTSLESERPKCSKRSGEATEVVVVGLQFCQ